MMGPTLAAAAQLLLALLPVSASAASNATEFSLLRQALTWEEYCVTMLKDFWDLVGPGGKLHPAYLLEHKAHLVIEGLLVVTILTLYIRRTFKPTAHSEDPLTEKEIDQLCREWEPEPLVPAVSNKIILDAPVIKSASGLQITFDNKKALTLSTSNFLGLAGDPSVLEACAQTIEKYGVGSCGPRGFYGTVDVHLELEEHLARFMGTEEAIIYSFDIATIASIIPAFASRKDTLVVDEYVSYPIQQGCTLSRAKVVTFKHNDMEDLERVLKQIDAQDKKESKPLTRRYVVVEGVYANYGDIAPLDKIVELKDRYRYRLIVEESFAFGTMGATGRGACQHFGLEPRQVEIICASMGNALGSVGGFCVGDHEMVDHQRLQGASYVYSASLPPFLSTAAIKTLERLTGNAPTLLKKLSKVTSLLRTELSKIPGIKLFGADADEASPVLHLQLARPPASASEAEGQLHRICEKVLAACGILLSVNPISGLDKTRPPSSIRLFSSVLLEEKDVAILATALRKAAKEVLGV